MLDQQRSLFDAPFPAIIEVMHDAGESLDTRFRRFIAANPHVVEAFIGFALELRAAGVRRYSAKAVVERLRWESAVRGHGEDFAWNNNYTSRLARLATDRCPALKGMFEFRRLQS
jgi:hypothetical protein